MKKINIPQLNKTVSCHEGDNLMKVLMDNGIPVASSCRGDGICGKCLIQIDEGINNLNKPNELEINTKSKQNINKNSRLSCQCVLHGDIKIKTTYW